MKKWLIVGSIVAILAYCLLGTFPALLGMSTAAATGANKQYSTPVPGDTLELEVTQQAHQISVMATQNAHSTNKLVEFGEAALVADTTSDISHDSRDAAWPLALMVCGVFGIVWLFKKK